jgi:hypothetical protein
MLKLSPVDERIAELEKALAHERAVSAAERRRAELLEETARRAYRLAAGAWPVRTDDAKGET